MLEALHRLGIGVINNLLQHRLRFFFAVAGDDKPVNANLDLMLILRRLTANIVHLGPDALHAVAVSEVPVGNAGSHVARGAGAAALEDLRARRQRLGFEDIVAKAVEVAGEGEALLLPDALQAADKLLRTQVALLVIEPRFADGLKLAPEPAADDIDRNARAVQVADSGNLLGRKRRVPRAGKQGSNHLQFFRRGQQRLGEGD